MTPIYLLPILFSLIAVVAGNIYLAYLKDKKNLEMQSNATIEKGENK